MQINENSELPEMFIGLVFNTPFESHCYVKSTPNEHGEFLALDSEGVETGFTLDMVHEIPLTMEHAHCQGFSNQEFTWTCYTHEIYGQLFV